MRKMILLLVGVVLLAGIWCSTDAAIVELPLACEGEYGFYDTWTAEFTLDVTFTDITNVYMDWSGEITAFQGMWGVVACQFVATLYESDPHDYFGRAYVHGGAGTYPDAEPFNLQSIFTSEHWGMLLDGHSRIEIWFGDTAHPFGAAGEDGTGSLDSGTLVIEGNVVPEPATLFLLGLGAVMVRRKR